jgi:putative ABC transport system substrate-binding protein
VKRRGFITALAGAAAWPLAGHAQEPERMRRVGVVIGYPEKHPSAQAFATAFVHALSAYGWVEGKNLQIYYRYAAGDPGLYEAYAAELVGLTLDAILASPGPAVIALRKQTRTIPIVFVLVPDPVGLGLVQSLARPGGNVTGFSSYDAPIIGKWLQLLKEIAPGVTRAAAIFNPDTALAPLLNHEIEAARSFGVTMTLSPVHDVAGIEEAIAAEAREPGGALVILPDSFTLTHRDVIVAAALHDRLPLTSWTDFARGGGLMSYWFDPVELYTRAASYIDRILKGANPAELPVQQPTKYSLIINLKTAKALGLTVPERVLDIADEVIE